MTYKRVFQAPYSGGWFFQFTKLDCTNEMGGPYETEGAAYIGLIHHPTYFAMRRLTQ